MRPVVFPVEHLVGELKQTLILRDLTVRELRRFTKACEIREYEAGERLVEQDSLGPDLDILLEGVVEVLLRGRDGVERTVNTIQKGDVLGEASIFTGLPRTASAVAKKTCVVAAVPRERLFAFCDRNPKAGLKIFTFVIYSLLKRLGATTRDLVAERESVVTRDDLERLRSSFPKSLEEMLES
jgi:CRP-like cAMP-binding protein